MSFRKDKSGQVMLTSAFLFAIIIAIIAIMLNNLIYSNNVAFLGFMGQSGYDELSIKQMTTDEAANAFVGSGGSLSQFSNYMSDYNKALNNITIQKGKYITVSGMAVQGSPNCDQQMSATLSTLSICEKNSNKTYQITTNYFKPAPAPIPAGDRDPGNVIVKVGSNASELTINPVGYALLIVEVVNSSTFMPEPGVKVKIFANGGHMIWIQGGVDVPNVLPTTPFEVITDNCGKASISYDCASFGQKIINASVGANPSLVSRNLSNNVTISIVGELIAYAPCGHTITVGSEDVDLTTSHGDNYVEVKIPIHIDPEYDFKSNSQPFEVSLTVSDANNLQLLSESHSYLQEINDKNVQSASDAYDNYVWIKLKRLDNGIPYSCTLKVTITAYCNLDHGDYSQVVTIPINGP